jgi:hypothetical protein
MLAFSHPGDQKMANLSIRKLDNFIYQALQRVHTYFDDPAEELDAARQEFTKSLIFSKAAEGAWVTVPRLTPNANHLSLEDVDIV